MITIINMLMTVKSNRFTRLGVLLVLNDRGMVQLLKNSIHSYLHYHYTIFHYIILSYTSYLVFTQERFLFEARRE